MVFEDIKNIKSGKRDLRKFGLTVGIALGIFGGLFLWRGKGYYDILFYIAGAFLLLSLTVPMVLKPIQKAWMTLAVILGWVMTRVILSILFFVVVTPIGLISRLFGKDFLDLEFDENSRSYWVPKEPRRTDKHDYEKQY
jgi:cellulose synthase/poly-beta-1,6-N-acetylglucosamine synthase-like glycosyltransferase